MANVIRTLKTVRPHIPLIKFPLRRQVVPAMSGNSDRKMCHKASFTVTMNGLGKPPSAEEQAGNAAVAVAASTPTPSKPVGSSPRGSGIDFMQLPAKYRRQLIETDEIEFIERGGPA